jgi:hypothetical protein
MPSALNIALFAQQAAADTGMNWPEAVMIATAILAVFATGTAVLVVLIWQGLGVWRARMVMAREAAYQRLAENMAASQETTLAELRKAAADIAEMKQRTAELERMLKEVE